MRRLSASLEVALAVTLAALVYASLAGPLLPRLLTAPTALGLAVVLVMNRLSGLPGYGAARWLVGGAGGLLLLCGIALLVAGAWLVVLGSLGIPVGFVAVPVALGMGGWGYTLLASALWSPRRRRKRAGLDPPAASATRPGTEPESDSPDAPNPT